MALLALSLLSVRQDLKPVLALYLIFEKFVRILKILRSMLYRRRTFSVSFMPSMKKTSCTTLYYAAA